MTRRRFWKGWRIELASLPFMLLALWVADGRLTFLQFCGVTFSTIVWVHLQNWDRWHRADLEEIQRRATRPLDQ